MSDFERKLAELFWANIRKLDVEHLSHIYAEETLVYCAFKEALDGALNEQREDIRDALIKESWDKLPRSCREETYTMVMSGRILQFFYDRFDAAVSSGLHLTDDDGTTFCILRALEETAAMLSDGFEDPYSFHTFWNKDCFMMPSLQKSRVIDMFRRRAMGISLYKLQDMRRLTTACGIERAVARVYCYLHSAWPSREVHESRIEDASFDLSSSKSMTEFIAQLLGPINPDNWGDIVPGKYQFAIREHIYGHPGHELQATNGLIVKRSHLTEVINTEFIRRFTNIPVPRIKAVYYHKRHLCVVMEEIKGMTLRKTLPNMSLEALDSLSNQLRAYMIEMAAAASYLCTSSRIGTLIGGPLSNVVFKPPPLSSIGNVPDFFRYWKERLVFNFDRSQCLAKVDELIERGVSAPIVFSHGDLSPANIIIGASENENGTTYQIAAIIDWECSGFYPDFWEKVLAYRSNVPRTWVTRVVDTLPTSSEELTLWSGSFWEASLPRFY